MNCIKHLFALLVFQKELKGGYLFESLRPTVSENVTGIQTLKVQTHHQFAPRTHKTFIFCITHKLDTVGCKCTMYISMYKLGVNTSKEPVKILNVEYISMPKDRFISLPAVHCSIQVQQDP